MVPTLCGIACSAANIIASVMWFIFSSMSVDKFNVSAKISRYLSKLASFLVPYFPFECFILRSYKFHYY